MKTILSSAAVVAACFSLGGCVVSTSDSSTPSSSRSSNPPSTQRGSNSAAYDVSELSASMSAQCDGNNLRVYAALLHDAGQFIRLDQGDYFTVRINGGPEIEMQTESDGVTLHYMASFPPNTDPTDALVALHRPSGKNGAPLSQVRIAGGFSVAEPSASVKAGEGLYFRMSPAPASASDVRVELEGSCVNVATKLTARTAADGRLFVDTTGVLKPNLGGCDVTAHVRTETYGQVDSVFRRGMLNSIDAMEGLQVRTFHTQIAP